MDQEYRKDIVEYYDQTRLDYKWLWLNKKNRSVHFGYYETGIDQHSQALENLNRKMATAIDLKSSDYVLDAGCGQGGSAMWMAEQYNARVEGVTLVPHQVEIAQKETLERGLNGIRFSVQDYCNTNYEDNTFDVLWACESMCHAESKLAFYKEAYRVLKPGGRLVCADYIRSDRPLSQLQEQLLESWLSGWSIKDIDTTEEHIKHMNSVGFSEIKLRDVTDNTKPSLQHLYRMSKRLWKLGKFLKRFGIRNDVNHGNQRASIKQFEALENDAWYYSFITALKPEND